MSDTASTSLPKPHSNAYNRLLLLVAGIGGLLYGVDVGIIGGALPYLEERLDRGWDAFAECRERISTLPTEHLRRFFYDTVNFDPRALRFAMDFAGASQILAGSDYPHQIGSIPKMKESLASAAASDVERRLILGENARRLYKL